ncbi:MAG: hypothetical protein JKY94_17675 [Rhodobacteraceae bacterium]|nr:hypothetical protein [Paracoccaceae bacterium]
MLKDLEKYFRDMDATVLDRTQDWALGRASALLEFQRSSAHRRNACDFSVHDRYVRICGGDKWFRIIKSHSREQICREVIRICGRQSLQRDELIQTRLAGAGISTVCGRLLGTSNRGYAGHYRAGGKVVSFKGRWIEREAHRRPYPQVTMTIK